MPDESGVETKSITVLSFIGKETYIVMTKTNFLKQLLRIHTDTPINQWFQHLSCFDSDIFEVALTMCLFFLFRGQPTFHSAPFK